MTGHQFDLCLRDGVRTMGRLTVGMEMAVSSSLATGGQDGNGLQLEKVGPPFSSSAGVSMSNP